MGIPDKKADLRSMPKPVRWFGYFFYFAFAVMTIVLVVSYVLYHS